jgi:hypothetical protein
LCVSRDAFAIFVDGAIAIVVFAITGFCLGEDFILAVTKAIAISLAGLCPCPTRSDILCASWACVTRFGLVGFADGALLQAASACCVFGAGRACVPGEAAVGLFGTALDGVAVCTTEGAGLAFIFAIFDALLVFANLVAFASDPFFALTPKPV